MRGLAHCVVTAVLGVVVSLALAPQAWAYGPPKPTREGFLLRLSGGLGYARTGLDATDGEISLSGSSGDLNVAAGAIVAPDLALHATLGGWNVLSPTMELSANGSSNTSTINNASFSATFLGGGLTTYFGDNFYFSGSLGLIMLSLKAGKYKSKSDTGFGLDLSLGREWLVSPQWGMGVAAGLSAHTIEVKDFEGSFRGGSLSIRFSTTYN